MSFGEMLLLSLLAFLLLGPKKTPEVARQVAQTIARIKRTASDLQASLTLESVSLPLEAITDPTIEAHRQTIIGVIPAAMTAPAGDVETAVGETGASSAVAHPKVGLLQASEEMYA